MAWRGPVQGTASLPPWSSFAPAQGGAGPYLRAALRPRPRGHGGAGHLASVHQRPPLRAGRIHQPSPWSGFRPGIRAPCSSRFGTLTTVAPSGARILVRCFESRCRKSESIAPWCAVCGHKGTTDWLRAQDLSGCGGRCPGLRPAPREDRESTWPAATAWPASVGSAVVLTPKDLGRRSRRGASSRPRVGEVLHRQSVQRFDLMGPQKPG